ncbi:MAG: hypothetical protein BWZ07_03190 [Alphaproteobacteria bacterium ADurb.BinA280]|nr:MAG: hypothetical protein BWZ07_03190 [Alphaproteobacteria bacterium ADurb.BinA280]
MLPHFVQREQALVLDRLDDDTFADAVAATDLIGVLHLGGFAVPFVADVTDVGFTKHQVIANLVDGLAFAQ